MPVVNESEDPMKSLLTPKSNQRGDIKYVSSSIFTCDSWLTHHKDGSAIHSSSYAATVQLHCTSHSAMQIISELFTNRCISSCIPIVGAIELGAPDFDDVHKTLKQDPLDTFVELGYPVLKVSISL
jgi:hypothetical protein